LSLALVGAWFAFNHWRSVTRLPAENRAVFITGCDTGFGHLLAQQLDAMGMRVFAGCLTDEHGAKLGEKLSAKSKVIKLNVCDQKSVDAAYDQVNATLAGDGLWGLVNNAGIADGALVEWTSLQQFQRVMDVNLWGMVRCSKKFLGLVKKARGRIINMTSIAGLAAAPGAAAYNASKFAAEGFSDTLRHEMKPWKVTVCTIEPGFMKTPIVDTTPSVLKRVWAEVDPSIQAAYGDDYPEQLTQNFVKMAAKAGAPEIVVQTYVEALLSVWPKGRYVVGVDAKIIRVLARLPAWVLSGVFSMILPKPRAMQGLGLAK